MAHVPYIDGPDHKGKVYTKVVNTRELDFTRKAEGEGITPKIISVKKYRGKVYNYRPEGEGKNKVYIIDNEHKTLSTADYYEMVSELYPSTLEVYLDKTNDTTVFKKVAKQAKKLHELGIFHGDLTQQNIVINPETGDVRIIDLGNSDLISKVTNEEAQNDEFCWDRTFDTREELLLHEENEIYTYAKG